jgi:hypothetical protein
LQTVCGQFLFYSRAVDPTMLHELNRLAASQTKGTQSTMAEMIHFLNYAASHPDSKIRYVASDMILHVHSDASYLTEPEARSRAGGHFFLSSNPKDEPILNGPILSVVKTIRAVMSSAAEAGVGATFYNCKAAVPLRTALEELGHAQPPTPVQVDNATAVGIANRTVKQVRSRAMDMRFYWIQDRIDQNQFHVFWAPAKTNLGGFYTKQHPIHHHRTVRPGITNFPESALPSHLLRGCIDPDYLATGTGADAGLRRVCITETRKTRASGRLQQYCYNHIDCCNVGRQPASQPPLSASRFKAQTSNTSK